MKKRILALLLCLVMVFALCACGGGDADDGKDDDKGGSISSGSDSSSSDSNGGSNSVKADTNEAVELTKAYLNSFFGGDAEGTYNAANWDKWYGACVGNGTLDKDDYPTRKEYRIYYYQSQIDDIGEMYGGGWYYSFEITDVREVSQSNVEDWNEYIYEKCGYECTASCIVDFTYTIEGDNGTTDTYEGSAQWFFVGGVWMMPFD